MFYKKSKLKVGDKEKWFPRAVVLTRHPATMKDLAKQLARMSTASPGDVYLVLSNLSKVMAQFMDEGRPVHIEGLGSFYYKLSCAGRGVDTPEEVSRKQIKAVRVQFLHERSGRGRHMHRPLTEGVSLVEITPKEEENIEEMESEA